MALKPGSTKQPLHGFAGSMAEEMEKAFREELGRNISDRHLRLIFVAVARGVVRHLRKNPTAFKVQVNLPGNQEAEGTVKKIETEEP